MESCSDVELIDGSDVVARPEKITIFANERDPSSWHGWMELGRFPDDVETMSAKACYVYTVRFRYNGSRFTGIARIAGDPVATEKSLRVDLCGVDILYLN
jgi:hypothetical protein